MARDLLEEDYYYVHGGPIPVKWTAPEVITIQLTGGLYQSVSMRFFHLGVNF